MTRRVILALVVAAACAPAATGATASPVTQTAVGATARTATASPINVDDMMGGSFSPATVFTLVGGEIHAVKLQNHHVPYRIKVTGKAHAFARPEGSRLYVADREGGSTRIRSFDTSTGSQLETVSITKEPAGDAALTQDGADRLLLLLETGAGVRVEAFRSSPLTSLGAIYKAPCGDRLLASPVRIAIICSSTGMMSIGSVVADGSIHGPQGGLITVPGAPVVASAMFSDGTILLGTARGIVYKVAGHSTDVVTAFEAPEGSLVSDGIAAADGRLAVIFTRSGDEGAASVHHVRTGSRVDGPWRVQVRGPRALALWPFAYFVGERGLWHVDLRNGLVERMLTLDAPVPLTVTTR